MKSIITSIILLAVMSGCANIENRSGQNGTPMFCSPSIYKSTEEVWNECVMAPFRLSKADGGDGMWYAIATMTWPIWLADEVMETVLDTMFLPVDGIYTMSKGTR